MINKDELLFVVDENSNPVEPKSRGEVHSKGLWHRVSHIWIINSQKQILCQRRSLLKDTNPGFWEAFFGGHLNPGVSYEDGALEELNEELGFNAKKDQLVLFKIYKRKESTEFQGIFLFKWDGDINNIKFEKDEIDQLNWYALEEVKQILANKNPAWSLMGYEKELFNWLK